jgi:hypothetical protein
MVSKFENYVKFAIGQNIAIAKLVFPTREKAVEIILMK